MVRRIQRGFTLVEMLCVLIIVTVMSGTLAVYLQNRRDLVGHVERIDRWQDQARASLNRIATDVRESGVVEWDGADLTLRPRGETVTYRVTESDGTMVLTRNVAGWSTVMATDVAQLEVENERSLVTVRLDFFTWIGDYRARASHGTAIAVPLHASRAEAP